METPQTHDDNEVQRHSLKLSFHGIELPVFISLQTNQLTCAHACFGRQVWR
jgi:hypothetical protein